MLQIPHRGRRAVAGAVTLGALAFAAAPAVAAPFSTACTNTVTNNNTQVDVTEMSGAVPAQVQPDTAFSVKDIKGIVKIPASVFEAGYGLELINDGDQLDGTIQMTMGGTNTAQLNQLSGIGTFKATVRVTDPDGVPHSGDETFSDEPVPFALPDMAWTSGPDENKTMDFSMIPIAKTPAQKDKGGMALTASIPTKDSEGNPGPPLTVKFGCNPGTVTGDAPGTANYTDSAAPYATSTIKKDAPVVEPPVITPPPAGGGTTGPGAVVNEFTFGKLKLNRKKGTAELSVNVPGAGLLILDKGKTQRKVARPTEAGDVKLVVKARGAAKRKLARKGKLKVNLTVSYTPSGGAQLTKTKTVTLKKAKAKKKKKK